MASAAQRKWAAKHRAAAAAEPKKYESVRIKSSVDRAKEKTEKARESAATVGREYRGPTPEQIASGTLEVGTPTTAHRAQARAVSLLQPAIKTGEIPKELVALKVHEKTLGLMEQALSPEVHPIVSGVYRGTEAGFEKYQAQFGEYETEYVDYLKEYDRIKRRYDIQQQQIRGAEGLQRGEVGGVQVITPTVTTAIPTREPEYKPKKDIPIGAAGVLQQLEKVPEPHAQLIDPYYLRPKGYTMSDYIGGFKASDVFLGERIPSISEIIESGAKFKVKYPDVAEKLYGSLTVGAAVVKAPIGVLEKIEKTIDVTTKPSEFYKSHVGAAGHLATEFYEKFEKQPVETVETYIGVPVAMGGVAGAGFKLTTFATKLSLKRGVQAFGAETVVGKGLYGISKAVDPALTVGMVGSIGKEIIEAPTPEKRIQTVSDVGLGLVGAVAGWRMMGKTIEAFQVRGRVELPTTAIIEPTVLSKAEPFPMTRKGETAQKLVTRFKETEFKLPSEEGVSVWHATPEAFKKTITVGSIATRPSDVPGLYTAPSLSPYFLRVTKGKQLSVYSWLFGGGESIEPTALRVKVSDVVRLPESVRYDVMKASEFLTTRAKKGEATITPVVETVLRGKGKAEAEAVITPETVLKKVESEYFFKIDGHKIPIDTYRSISIEKTPVGDIGFVKTHTVKVGELKTQTELYKPYERGLFKPPQQLITSIKSDRKYEVPPPYPSEYRLPSREPSFVYPPFEKIIKYDPIKRYREDGVSRVQKVSSVTSISEIIRPTERIQPPREEKKVSTVGAIYIPPRYISPQIKKEEEKEKIIKKPSMKGFEWFIVNPIASPFGISSVGSIKKNGGKK